MSRELHDADAERVIAEQITAAILGGTQRPELRTDLTGAMERFRVGLAKAVEVLAPTLQQFEAALTTAGQRMADDAERFANGGKP